MFLFAAAELVVTVAWRPSVVGPERYEDFALDFDYAYAPDFPRLFREGERLRYYPTEYADMKEFDIAREKGAGEIRVFVLGSSVTRAFDVPAGKAYPEQLERFLRERHPEHDWQVVDLSASGFGTTRMLHVLRNMLPYDPDIVIVHPHGSNEYEDERDARYRAELHAGLNGVFLRSRLVVLLKKLQAARLHPDGQQGEAANAEQIAGRDPANLARWQATIIRNVEAIEELDDERDIPTIYVARAGRDGDFYSSETEERLNGPIRDRRYYVDVPAIFAGDAAEHAAADLFLNWTHYTMLGHRYVAEALHEQIRPGSEIFARITARRAAMESGPRAEGREAVDGRQVVSEHGHL